MNATMSAVRRPCVVFVGEGGLNSAVRDQRIGSRATPRTVLVLTCTSIGVRRQRGMLYFAPPAWSSWPRAGGRHRIVRHGGVAPEHPDRDQSRRGLDGAARNSAAGQGVVWSSRSRTTARRPLQRGRVPPATPRTCTARRRPGMTKASDAVALAAGLAACSRGADERTRGLRGAAPRRRDVTVRSHDGVATVKIRGRPQDPQRHAQGPQPDPPCTATSTLKLPSLRSTAAAHTLCAAIVAPPRSTMYPQGPALDADVVRFIELFYEFDAVARGDRETEDRITVRADRRRSRPRGGPRGLGRAEGEARSRGGSRDEDAVAQRRRPAPHTK